MPSKKSTEDSKSANRTESRKSNETSSLLDVDLIFANEAPRELSQIMKSFVKEILKQKDSLIQKGGTLLK